MGMNLKVKILGISLFILSFPVISGGIGAGQEQSFDQHKQNILTRMQQQLAMTQQNITCVQNANDNTSLQSCMQAAKAAHEAIRAQHEGHHGNMQ